MKKLVLIVFLVVLLTAASITVFAANSDTSSTPNAVDTIISRVTGTNSNEIAKSRCEGVGYGRLIPASILSKRLGISIEEAVKMKETGKTYAQIAEENGISLEDYKSDVLEKKKELIDEKVESGYLTPEQGEQIKDRISESISNCDGTGSQRGSCGMGGYGQGQGNGCGRGRGMGTGGGRGCGSRFAQ